MPCPTAVRQLPLFIGKEITADALTFPLFDSPQVPPRPPAHLLGLLLGHKFGRGFRVMTRIEALQNGDQLWLVDLGLQGRVCGPCRGSSPLALGSTPHSRTIGSLPIVAKPVKGGGRLCGPPRASHCHGRDDGCGAEWHGL